MEYWFLGEGKGVDEGYDRKVEVIVKERWGPICGVLG
jgi:hypothetical protein